jgi:hypothetical protein
VNKAALKKQRLKEFNQRLALGQVDLRTSMEHLMEKVDNIRLEVDFMVIKQQCNKVPKSPILNRYGHKIKNNPFLQSIEIESSSSLLESFENRFFSPSPNKKKATTAPFSPNAKSPAKDNFSPYSPIGMSR